MAKDKTTNNETDKAKMKRFTVAAPKGDKANGVKLSIRTMPVSLLGSRLTEAFKQVATETGNQPETVRGVLTVYLKGE